MVRDISNELYQHIMEQNRTTPYHRLLEMNITDLSYGYCQAEMLLQEKHLNPMGIAHGGAGFSILDVVMGTAATTIGLQSTTIEMNINYFRPAREGERLIARGWIIKEGKSILVAEGKLYRHSREEEDEELELLAVSRQSMKNLGEG